MSKRWLAFYALMQGKHFSKDAVTGDSPSSNRFSFVSSRWWRIISLLGLFVAVLAPFIAMGSLSTSRSTDRTWYWNNPLPQGNRITSLSFVSANDGWATGRSGVVLKTSDAGATWRFSDAGSATDWNSASFVTTSTGWIAGADGAIRKTTDAGSTWTTQSAGASTTLHGISFADPSVGITVGDATTSSATIRFTSDGGNTWFSGQTTSTANLNAVAVSSPNLAWAVGGHGTMLKSLDGGSAWSLYPAMTAASLNGVAFAPGTGTGYAVGNASGTTWNVFKTVNGNTWTRLSLPGAGRSLLSVACSPDGSKVAVAGTGGVVLRSNDGGATWTNQSPARLGNVNFRALALPTSASANLAGDHGMMLASRDGGDSWLSDMQQTPYAINDSSFVTSSVGWAVGNGGVLMHTSDGAAHWNAKRIASVNLHGVDFANANFGVAVGDGGTVARTSDGGASWSVASVGSNRRLNDVVFTSTSNGCVVGDGGTIYVTTNGGASWGAATSGTRANLKGLTFSDAAHGWAVGDGGVVLVTSNGGATWSRQNSGTTINLRGVFANDSTHAMAVGELGTAIRTTNGGATWANMSPAVGATTESLNSVYMSDNSHAWVGGSAGFLRATTDGGVTFSTQNSGMPTQASDMAAAINSVFFADNEHGFVLGDFGEVRSTTNAGANWSPSYYATLSTINAVKSTTASDVRAVGDAGAIIGTFDGGRSWFSQDSANASNLRAMCSDAGRVWAVGENGTIRTSTDYGWTWNSQTSGTARQLNGISSPDGVNAVAVGDGVVLRTANSGATWASSTPTATARPLNGIAMVNATTGWAVASRNDTATVIKTTDGGASWESQSPTTAVGFNAVHFRPGGLLGWVVGDRGAIYATTDGGSTWTKQDSGTTQPLYAVSFHDDSIGWASGANGVVLRTANGGSTWVVQDPGTTSADIRGLSVPDLHSIWAVGQSGAVLKGYDGVLPVTTLVVSPASPDGQAGWFVSNPTVQLEMNEAGISWYNFGALTDSFIKYTSPFLVPQGVSNTLNYYSSDLAGNSEAARSETYHVDISDPTTPTALVVDPSTITSSSATLHWAEANDTVSGVSAYQVYVNNHPYQSTTTTQATLTGLNPNSSYNVYVTAIDVAGNISGASNAQTFATTDTAGAALGTALSADPIDPDGLSGWYIARPQIKLSAVPDTDTVPSETFWAVSSSAEATPSEWTTYTAPFSAPAGDYTMWYYSAATGDPSRPVRYETQAFKVDPYAVASPTSIDATATSAYGASVSWSPTSAVPASGVKRYELFKSVDTTDNFEYVSSTASDTLSYTVPGLAPSTRYWFKVRAVSVAGTEGDFTDPVSIDTLSPPLPEPPHAVYVRSTDGNTNYIDWDPAPTVMGTPRYRVWKSIDGVAYSALATITAEHSYAYVDTDVAASTKYWYAVSTIDFRGESPLGSSPSNLTSVTVGPPVRPAGLFSVDSSGSALLSWTPSMDPTARYKVYRSEASLATATVLTTVPITATSFADFGLTNGKQYYYSVSSVDASGAESPRSIELLSQPQAPEGAYSPHGTVDSPEDDCAACHRSHTGQSPELLYPMTATASIDATVAQRGTALGQQLCLNCHNGGVGRDLASSVEATSYGSRHPITTDSNFGTIRCGSCHESHRSNKTPDPSLLDVGGKLTGDAVCFGCHGEGSTAEGGDLRVYEESAHKATNTSSKAAITCTKCHLNHTSPNEKLLRYSRYMVCVQCHSGQANASTPDIYSLLTADASNPHSRHNLTAEDNDSQGTRLTCQNCHNSMSLTKSTPLVDPDNPSTSGGWTQGVNTFCFRCHDGELPTQDQTQPWVDSPLSYNGLTSTVDIQSAYQANAHGSGDSTATVHLQPEMGYKVGDTLKCTVCHDGHGTVNSYALRQNISSADGSVRREGLLVAPVPGGGFDFRFFCNACHDLRSANHTAADISTFPTDCMGSGCHQHTMMGLGSQTTTETGTSF